jgi:hypothetical protein
VFVNTYRGLAALEAAGHAVAAVVQGQGVEKVAVAEGEHHWYADTEREEYVSQEACVIFLLAGPMAPYACGLADYESCDGRHVPPLHHWEAAEAISEWYDCPLFEVSFDDDEDEDLRALEADCLFELYKVRAMRFLKQPNRVSAVLALARELLTREQLPADEATALIQRHLASA